MKKCAVVGMAESTRHLAPWDDLETEIWVMNETGGTVGAAWLKRWDRSYQMHAHFDFSRKNNQNDPAHFEWLKAQTKPLYMQEVHEDIPASVKYPLEEIVAKYMGNYRRIGDDGKPLQFFESSAAYMIAHAGYEGYEQIGIYGIELSFESEYRKQSPNFHFWMGIIGQHAEIVIPQMSALLGGAKNVRYGYDQKPAFNPTQFGIRKMAMERDREKFLSQAKQLQEEGKIAEAQAKAFSGDAVRAKALKAKAKANELEVEQILAKVNILTGHVDECNFILGTMTQLNEALQGQVGPIEDGG